MTGRTIWLMLVALASMAGCTADGGAGRVAVGAPAPAYAATSLQGDTVSLASLRGEVVLLNLWATWCPPCREEMPALQAAHQELSGRGLRVVGVSIDEASSRAEIQQFLNDNGITFTILHDADQSVTNTFRTTGVPETFLIGRDGQLLRRWIGKVDPAAGDVRAAIDAALAEAS